MLPNDRKLCKVLTDICSAERGSNQGSLSLSISRTIPTNEHVQLARVSLTPFNDRLTFEETQTLAANASQITVNRTSRQFRKAPPRRLRPGPSPCITVYWIPSSENEDHASSRGHWTRTLYYTSPKLRLHRKCLLSPNTGDAKNEIKSIMNSGC